jgi:peroxiredoxin
MKQGIFIVFLLAALLAFAAGALSCTPSIVTPQPIGNVAPPEVGKQGSDITVTDLSGKPVRLSDFTGYSVLINFWAVDCDQCTMERGLFEAVHKEHPDIKIMMIDSKDDTGTVKRFVKNMAFNVPVYMDEQMIAAHYFDVHLLPESFLVDGNCIIKYIQNGAFADMAQLEDALNTLQ